VLGLALLCPAQTDSRQDGCRQAAYACPDNATAFDAGERTAQEFIKPFAFHVHCPPRLVLDRSDVSRAANSPRHRCRCALPSLPMSCAPVGITLPSQV